MEIDALRSFIAFVETGSFTDAGKQVFRSQSAISQQMKKLEEQTGKALFYKQGRQHGLTDEGKFLLSYARHIIGLHDEALMQLKKTQTIRPLYLGCPDDYVQLVLPKVIELIKAQQPDLSVYIHCHNSRQLRKMLNDGELDCAIVTRSDHFKQGYELLQDIGVWGFNGNINALKASIDSLGYMPLVLYDESCHFHTSAIQGLSQLKIASKVKYVSESLSAIQSLVMAGEGITMLAHCSLGSLTELKADTLGMALPKPPEITIDLIAGANGHPMFGRNQIEAISHSFNDLYLNDLYLINSKEVE